MSKFVVPDIHEKRRETSQKCAEISTKYREPSPNIPDISDKNCRELLRKLSEISNNYRILSFSGIGPL